MGESSYSSFYSSFLRTESSSNEDGDKKKDVEDMPRPKSSPIISEKPWRRPEPPWLDSVIVTSDLVYRYQVTAKSTTEVLEADMSALKLIAQPALVNEQLDQLYVGLELEGLSAKLSLSERNSSGSSGEDEEMGEGGRKKIQYSKLAMIYEENAPFPPPLMVGH